MKRDNLPASWSQITSQTGGTKTYTINGFCSVEAKFSSEKAELKTKVESGCEKPSLKVIFQALFPSVNVQQSTEKFILPEKFNFDELEIAVATKDVKVMSSAKDGWGIADRKLLLGGAKLTLEFTAGVAITGMKDWKIYAVGMSSSVFLCGLQLSFPLNYHPRAELRIFLLTADLCYNDSSIVLH